MRVVQDQYTARSLPSHREVGDYLPRDGRKMPDQKKQPCRNGALRANVKALKRLRTAKGWSQGELAKKAGCSKRTIESIESGNCGYLYIIGNLAKALAVEVVQLMDEDAEIADPAKSHPDNTISAWAVIEGDVSSFDQTDPLQQLVENMKLVLGATHEIIVLAVRKARSIGIELLFHPDDAYRFLDAFLTGKLEPLGIHTIKMIFTARWVGPGERDHELTIVSLNVPPVSGENYIYYSDSALMNDLRRMRKLPAVDADRNTPPADAKSGDGA
jgi:transcriptional regulator with XRE-family HTH domain